MISAFEGTFTVEHLNNFHEPININLIFDRIFEDEEDTRVLPHLYGIKKRLADSLTILTSKLFRLNNKLQRLILRTSKRRRFMKDYLNKIPDVRCCIYLAINLVNGKKYVGKTIGRVRTRIRSHIANSRSGLRKMAFDSALKKYGYESFEWRILFLSEDPLSLNILEKEFIIKENTRGKEGYNSTDGGEGVPGMIWSEEQVSRMVSNRKKIMIKCLSTGEEFSSTKEAAEKLGLYRCAISSTCRGRQDSTHGYEFEYLDPKLREVAKKTKESRVIATLIANKKSISAMQKASRKQVICLNDGKIYSSVTEASLSYGLHPSQVSNYCRGNHLNRSELLFEYY